MRPQPPPPHTERVLSFRLSTLLLFAFPALASLGPESGNLILQEFSPKQYGASPQNWAILQDRRGILYFANTDGLLEFDGVLWRRIPLPKGGTARSLGMDEHGTVYVGGQGEIGFLEVDPSGAARYASLLDRIAPEDRKFADVWSVLATPDGIYFSSYERLIRWRSGQTARAWKADAPFRRAFLLDGAVHVVLRGVGLMRLEKDTLQPVPGGALFAKLDIRGAYRDPRGNVVVTREGFFLQSPTGFEPLPTSVDPILKENQLYSFLPLPDGAILVGTARGGALLLDESANLSRILTRNTGLPSDYIAAVSRDSQGGIWLATGNGLVRFDLKLTQFDEQSGIRGSVQALARAGNTLYAGTSSGFFQLRPGARADAATLQVVPGLSEAVYALLAHRGTLWAGAQNGLYTLSGAKVERVFQTDLVYDVAASPRDPDLLYLAARTGAFQLRFQNGKWAEAARIPGAGQEFRTIAEDTDSLVWITTRTAILRADFRSTPPKVESFGESAGVPAGWKFAFRIDNRIVFGTEKGLLKFSPSEKKFLPDPSLGELFATGEKSVLQLRQDSQRNYWIGGSDYHGIVRKSPAALDWLSMPLLRAGLDELYAIQPDPDGVVWASGPDGRLIRYQPFDQATPPPLTVVLRRGPSTSRPLRYSGNSIRVEFAAPFFDALKSVEYQTRLDGADTDWTDWSTETWRDYTHLWEGSYRFQVRSRSPYGPVGPPTTLAFSVLPPWYRTWWAFVLYGLTSASLLWSVYRWRVKSLEESNRQLEATVHERTAEIRRQRDQIQEQEAKTESLLLNILPAPVAAELRDSGAVTPMHFDDVTVCFTDFVGFTLSSEKLDAKVLVSRLDEYFTAFDQIVSSHGLEKLKTIGDAYMFVSGLPKPSPTHAETAVRVALEIVEKATEIAARHADHPWRLRVGLHSGPVVAGVVGVRKFAFDIWGDTVNLASRMESSGVPGRVNLSAETYRRVKHVIECEPRGAVHTKDGRDLEMYFANRMLQRDFATARSTTPPAPPVCS